MNTHACIYLTRDGKCMHPERYGQVCDKGKCPIPRRKE